MLLPCLELSQDLSLFRKEFGAPDPLKSDPECSYSLLCLANLSDRHFLWEVLCASSPPLLFQHLSQSLFFPIPWFIFFLESTAFWNCYQMQVHVPNTLSGETLEFWTEKGLLQDHARRKWAHVPPNPKFQKGFSKAVLKSGEGGRLQSLWSFGVRFSDWLMVR